MSNEQIKFLKKNKLKKTIIFITQITIGISLIFGWELLSHYEIINSFVFS